MSTNFRMKRVTDPLNDKVKARIIGVGAGAGVDLRELGYISSGSEHSADNEADVVSPSFSGLFFGFPDDIDENHSPENENSGNELTGKSVDFDENDLYPSEMTIFHQNQNDLFRDVLCSHVHKAVENFGYLKVNKSVFRRNVMMFLRDFGYNAAICKSKWESSGGLTAGNYEFIDVIKFDALNQQTRYFIDLDFVSEFEIARPMKFYELLLTSLPEIFVGESGELRQILRTMSDAAKRSLKSKGLYIPPWRKHRFMQNKWLGPYKRTSNQIPVTAMKAVNATALLTPPLKCRSVGFESPAVNGGGYWLPAVTRTR